MQVDLTPDTGMVPVGEQLRDARTRGDQEMMADIVDVHGMDLAHSEYASLVYEIAADLPVELAEGRPGLAFRFEDLSRLPLGTTPFGLPGTLDDARVEFAINGDLRLRQVLLALTTRRRLGLYPEAMQLVEEALPLAEASVYPWYSGRSQILPYWYLHAGISALVSGDLETAHRYFLNAWTYRERDPYGFVVRDTAGKLAILAALSGDAAARTMWLQRAKEASRRPDLWVDNMIETDIATAQATRDVDALLPLSDADLRTTLTPSQRGSIWPLALWLSIRDALSVGNTSGAVRLLADTVEAHPPELRTAGLAGAIIQLVRADIHLAMGQGQQALAIIQDTPDVAGLTKTLHARILLFADQPGSALAIVGKLHGDRRVSPRAQLEALLVAAAANVALGARAEAISAAEEATSRIAEQDGLRVLATVPRAALDTLVADVHGLGDLLAQLDAKRVRDIYPGMVRLITVTRRERDLLRALRSGLTLARIAEESHVTVNTTRTHLANLRRKLDAPNRKEVLRKAEMLGLLDD